jgi:hypothetical protein
MQVNFECHPNNVMLHVIQRCPCRLKRFTETPKPNSDSSPKSKSRHPPLNANTNVPKGQTQPTMMQFSHHVTIRRLSHLPQRISNSHTESRKITHTNLFTISSCRTLQQSRSIPPLNHIPNSVLPLLPRLLLIRIIFRHSIRPVIPFIFHIFVDWFLGGFRRVTVFMFVFVR